MSALMVVEELQTSELQTDFELAWDEALREKNQREKSRAYALNVIEESFELHDNQPHFDAEAWRSRIIALVERENDVKWEIGDCLLEGEQFYPAPPDGEFPGMGFYAEVEAITGLSRNTLRDLASTARRVSPSVRTDKLTWSHHRTVINARPNATEDEIRGWLKRAAEEKMSVAALREALNPVKDPIEEKSFVVNVQLGVWEVLRDFADFEQSTVQKVAAKWLEETSNLPEMKAGREGLRKQTGQRRYQKRCRNGKRLARLDRLGVQR